MKVVSSTEMYAMERAAIQTNRVPDIVLMENAAYKTSLRCLDFLAGINNPRAVIVAGPGNNGGDGVAVARYLYMNDVETDVLFLGDPGGALPDGLAVNIEIIKTLPVRFINYNEKNFLSAAADAIGSAHLVVDALFGIGLKRPAEGIYDTIIKMINDNARRVLSVDVPSGVDADSGRVAGRAVRADATVTFTYPKVGLLLYPGAELAGEVFTEDIGITKLCRNHRTVVETLGRGDVMTLLPVRGKNTNKGSYGKIYAFAGCDGMPGAACLCCGAAYAAGAGLVRACVTEGVARVINARLPEAVTAVLPNENGFLYSESFETIKTSLSEADGIILGPGLGRTERTADFVRSVLKCADAPLVLDADGLNAIADDPGILLNLKKPAVVTPHPGEMSRLIKKTIAEITDDALETARGFAGKYGVVTVLKGARTVIASPDGSAYINTTGNPALAKAGSGDVLAGVIAAFIAQGADACRAAALGAYIHGEAGDAAAAAIGSYGVLAGDLFKYIPRVIEGYCGQARL